MTEKEHTPEIEATEEAFADLDLIEQEAADVSGGDAKAGFRFLLNVETLP
jgi:hypothetical protein